MPNSKAFIQCLCWVNINQGYNSGYELTEGRVELASAKFFWRLLATFGDFWQLFDTSDRLNSQVTNLTHKWPIKSQVTN